MPGSSTEYRTEVLVVGSGAGGALTAALLAEGGNDVLLVEEGPYIIPGTLRPFSIDEFRLQYREGGITPALGNPPFPYVEGCCVGGGTEVNSALYHRPPPDIVENWKHIWKIADFNVDSLETFCRKNEEEIGVSNLHGPPSALSNVLLRGANALGWKALEVPRLYRYSDEIPGGVKQTMSRAVIPRGISAGMRIFPECRVLRLHGSGNRIRFAEALRNMRSLRSKIMIRADRYIICAGSIQTPLILLRSGIGRNIGRTFGVHPTIKCAAMFEEPLNGHLEGVPVHQVKEFSPEVSIGGSISTPAHLGMYFANNWLTHESDIREWRRIGIYYAAVRGTINGSVRAIPGATRSYIVKYQVTTEEVRLLWKGMERLGDLLLASGAQTLYPSVSRTAPLRDRESWRKFIDRIPDPGRISLMTIHLFGTCPMGEDLSRCATDSFGKVHGFKNLWINDASLIPDSPSVNPEGTILAFARRNVEEILSGSVA